MWKNLWITKNPAAPVAGPGTGTPGWLRPEKGRWVDPRARTRHSHSSQAEILGISLNHKSNLVPSGSIGPPHQVSWPLRGDEDKYTLLSFEEWKPTTDKDIKPFLLWPRATRPSLLWPRAMS